MDFTCLCLDSVSGLYLLNGGKRQKLYYDIRYYYNNLPEYVTRVRDALLPYQKALSMVSDEVKLIGGTGTVHGCIVDIDFFKHVYLNPFDGKVTPYFAFNITDKVVFDNMILLLESSPFPPIQQRNKSILSRFMTMSQGRQIAGFILQYEQGVETCNRSAGCLRQNQCINHPALCDQLYIFSTRM